MSKFVFVYHGGNADASTASPDEIMAAWGAWFGSLGAAIIDGGNPTGQAKTVGAHGAVDGGGSNPITGYSLIDAPSLAAAAALAAGCPVLKSGGTVEVAETFDM